MNRVQKLPGVEGETEPDRCYLAGIRSLRPIECCSAVCLAASHPLCALSIWKSLIRLSWPLSGWMALATQHPIVAAYRFGLHRTTRQVEQNALTAAHTCIYCVWIWSECGDRHTFSNVLDVNAVHFDKIVRPVYWTIERLRAAAFAVTTHHFAIFVLFFVYTIKSLFFFLFFAFRSATIFQNE